MKMTIKIVGVISKISNIGINLRRPRIGKGITIRASRCSKAVTIFITKCVRQCRCLCAGRERRTIYSRINHDARLCAGAHSNSIRGPALAILTIKWSFLLSLHA